MSSMFSIRIVPWLPTRRTMLSQKRGQPLTGFIGTCVEPIAAGMPEAIVGFGGVRRKVCLAYTPDAAIGDYVLVHVGFSISKLDEEEAGRIFQELEAIGAMEEIEEEEIEEEDP